jgi:hypothetical protein
MDSLVRHKNDKGNEGTDIVGQVYLNKITHLGNEIHSFLLTCFWLATLQYLLIMIYFMRLSMALNGRINEQLKRIWKETFMAQFKYYPRISL